MTAPTHIISGLAGVVLLSNASGETPQAIDLLAVVIGTLLPDIEGNGVITRPGKVLRQLIGRALGDLLDLVMGIAAFALRAVFGHRGFLHSFAMPLILFLGSIAYSNTWLGWLSFGYAIHLLGDIVTVAGIPALSPIFKTRFSIPLFKTGSAVEFACATLLLGFTVTSGWKLLPAEVKRTHSRILGPLTTVGSTAYVTETKQESRQRTLARKLTSGALAQR